ncbi:MAG: PIN domain-containing protein [Chloroflexota bacterium]|nr:PIN domain-containing protein [Chloroflexota bacterium]
MALPFLDTNILLRHLRQDQPILSPRATAILDRVERGELSVRTSDIVVFEAVFALQRSYREPRDRIAAGLLPIIELPGIVLPGKRHYRSIFDLYVGGGLGFADCYHVVLMQRLKLSDILTFDTDFDGVPGIRRREG